MVRIYNHYKDPNNQWNEYAHDKREGNIRKSDGMGITLLSCKFALIELLNEEISLRSIAKVLMNSCRWNFMDGLVSFDQFSELVKTILSHPEFYGFRFHSLEDMYAEFDRTEKGWIRNTEFNETIWFDYPKLSNIYAEEWFRLADPNSTGRV